MKMRRQSVVIVLIWGLLSSFGPGDGFRAKFRAVAGAGNQAEAGRVLAAWQKAAPNDPDLYVARFNWLLQRAERVELQPGTGAPAGEGLRVSDKAGRQVATIGSGYDPALVKQAAAELGKGIALAPDRLDMRFGLAKMYEMTGQPAAQLRVLQATLAARAKSGRAWRWRDDGPLPASEAAFVPSSLEDYASVYWQLEDYASVYWQQEGADAPAHGRALAALIEQYYPQSSLGPFNMGVYFQLTKQPAQAYARLQRADALKPNDASTLGNLTMLATDLKRKDEATRYLARLRKLPNTKEAADAYAKELRKL